MRNSFMDNAKIILIVLVVLGHLMSGLLGENEVFDSIYMLLYTFHMPAFVYLTGALSKKCKSVKQFWKMIMTLLVPYLVFQLVYTIFYERVYDEPIEFEWLMPRMALWYLLSLFVWRLLLLFFPKSIWSIAAALVISLIAGNYENINDWASLSRTLFFFVYFIAGHRYGLSFFENKTGKIHIIRILGVAVSAWAIIKMGDAHYREWLLGRSSYEEMTPILFETDYLNRLVIYAVGFAMLSFFFSFVPKRTYWFTEYGSRTLAVYLLHLFIVKFVKESDWYLEIIETGSYWLLIVLSVSITYVLSQTIFTKILTPIKTYKELRKKGYMYL